MHELLTSEQMGEADRLTIQAGVPGIELMERAGRAVAERAAQMFAGDGTILVVCGPGNNGGDGFIAAEALRQQGRDVRLVLFGVRERLSADAARAADRWGGPVTCFDETQLNGVAGVIDALFGAGLQRDLENSAANLVNALNQANLPVLSIDLPSGIEGSTGQIRGVAVRATRTISFFRRKPGHLLLPGRDYCGPVEIVDIGISSKVLDVIMPQVFCNDPAIWWPRYPIPKLTDHKYKRGHALVVSGGAQSTGAARLAAMAALRMGAGLVTLVCPDEALAINAAQLTAIMVKSFGERSSFPRLIADKRKNVVVIGPGAGVNSKTQEAVLELLKSDKAVVIDADALTCFQQDLDVLFGAIRHRFAPTVLTPHDGEYLKLFGDRSQKDEAGNISRLQKACDGAKKSGALLVMKGPDTVIAEPGGRAVINNNAPAFLATAGSGDVLAGMIGGLLAQHMPVFDAASAAVWLHGDAARDFGPGLISEDLPNLLPAALRRLKRF